jgi:SNF2 family DNA or RNA helicase
MSTAVAPNNHQHRFHSNAVVSQLLQVHELNDRDERIQHPENTKIKLWPHQLTMVSRCLKYENGHISPQRFPHVRDHDRIHADDFISTQVGVICDSVGAGKSYAILALIMSQYNGQHDTNKITTIKSYGNDRVHVSWNRSYIPVRTSMLVIPHILVSQWKRYISEFSDSIRHTIISKQSQCNNFVETILPRLDETDLVVVTCSFYNQIAREIMQSNYCMRRVVYDEVDNMNIPNCKNVNSRFYWFVTASYANLLYPRGNYYYDNDAQRTVWHCSGLHNSGFVKNVFMDLSFNLPIDYFKTLFLKNSDTYIHESISLPDPNYQIVRCATPPEIQILTGFANEDVIQCLNARDITSALRLVNPRQVSDEDNLVGLQISRLVKDLHNMSVRIELARSLEYDDPSAQEQDINRLMDRKGELESRIEGIKERIRSCDTCCICYDTIHIKTLTPCCSNAFCFECLTRWLARKKNCPLCKSNVNSTELLTIQQQQPSPHTGTLSEEIHDRNRICDSNDKIRNLKALLTNNLDPVTSKILVFSSYDMSLHSITAALRQDDLADKYKCKCLRGNETQVQTIVQNYRSISGQNMLNMLFVNAKNFGSGINLENTTDIIMFHKLDSELEKQVIGRAQRLGRTAPLKVWYLLHENEIDASSSPRI